MRNLFFVTLVLATGCSGDTGNEEDCVTDVSCFDNDDCQPGHRCNHELDPPACTELYCGGTSAPCSTDIFCAKPLGCVQGQCTSVPGTPQALCRRDAHCNDGLDCIHGECRPVPGRTGAPCEHDGQCTERCRSDRCT